MARYGYAKRSIPSCMGPNLRAPAATVSAPIGHLDVATLVKVSQAVSDEMDLEKLIDALMRLAMEHAGAERGVLLLPHGDELRQEAEALASGLGIVVRRRAGIVSAIPDSVVRAVIRTREVVVLDDASRHPTCSTGYCDRESAARSIVCVPLVAEAKVSGVLYLENNLTPHVFTPDRVTVLKVLASQAAIALEKFPSSSCARSKRASAARGVRRDPGARRDPLPGR